MIVINEDKKTRAPDAIVLTHLPDGPTAHFKLTSIKYPKEIAVMSIKDWRIMMTPEKDKRGLIFQHPVFLGAWKVYQSLS